MNGRMRIIVQLVVTNDTLLTIENMGFQKITCVDFFSFVFCPHPSGYGFGIQPKLNFCSCITYRRKYTWVEWWTVSKIYAGCRLRWSQAWTLWTYPVASFVWILFVRGKPTDEPCPNLNVVWKTASERSSHNPSTRSYFCTGKNIPSTFFFIFSEFILKQDANRAYSDAGNRWNAIACYVVYNSSTPWSSVLVCIRFVIVSKMRRL